MTFQLGLTWLLRSNHGSGKYGATFWRLHHLESIDSPQLLWSLVHHGPLLQIATELGSGDRHLFSPQGKLIFLWVLESPLNQFGGRVNQEPGAQKNSLTQTFFLKIERNTQKLILSTLIVFDEQIVILHVSPKYIELV